MQYIWEIAVYFFSYYCQLFNSSCGKSCIQKLILLICFISIFFESQEAATILVYLFLIWVYNGIFGKFYFRAFLLYSLLISNCTTHHISVIHHFNKFINLVPWNIPLNNMECFSLWRGKMQYICLLILISNFGL